MATTTDETYGNIKTSKKELTGVYIADKYSNICDLLGNCYEWTTEYYSPSGTRSHCVGRGGSYSYASNASERNASSSGISGEKQSFRLQIYVQ